MDGWTEKEIRGAKGGRKDGKWKEEKMDGWTDDTCQGLHMVQCKSVEQSMHAINAMQRVYSVLFEAI